MHYAQKFVAHADNADGNAPRREIAHVSRETILGSISRFIVFVSVPVLVYFFYQIISFSMLRLIGAGALLFILSYVICRFALYFFEKSGNK